MRLQIEIKTELFKANLALVGLFSCMHKHVTLQLSIVKKPLIACLKRALKLNFFEQVQLSTYQLVAMHSHVLFEGGSVVENFCAGLKMTFENSWLRGHTVTESC